MWEKNNNNNNNNKRTNKRQTQFYVISRVGVVMYKTQKTRKSVGGYLLLETNTHTHTHTHTYIYIYIYMINEYILDIYI